MGIKKKRPGLLSVRKATGLVHIWQLTLRSMTYCPYIVKRILIIRLYRYANKRKSD